MWRYVAYGLQLRSSFLLPGMQPAASPDLPVLTIVPSTRVAMGRAWSGPSRLARWRGDLRDGRSLTIERGTAGDTLFTYGSLGLFHLDLSLGRLLCVPEATAGWQRVLIGKVLSHVSLMFGYEALHASVIDSPDGVVGFVGPSGAGKSTLARELMGHGWRFFADDVMTLAADPTGVYAHPATPHMTVTGSATPDSDRLEGFATLARGPDERWLRVERATREPRPVRMLCLLERGPQLALGAEQLPANPLPL